jgi:hypothetical protein
MRRNEVSTVISVVCLLCSLRKRSMNKRQLPRSVGQYPNWPRLAFVYHGHGFRSAKLGFNLLELCAYLELENLLGDFRTLEDQMTILWRNQLGTRL